MQKSLHVFSVFVMTLVLILCQTPDALAKKYAITAVNIEAQLQNNGDMSVSESRTYQFDGKYSYAFVKIPKHPRVKWRHFRLLEDGRKYLKGDSEKPGTYRVIRRSSEIEIRWFFNARNETRTFQLNYLAQNVVERFYDGAVVYYQFIGDAWSKSQQNVEVNVLPPQALTANEVRTWLHGPLWANIDIQRDGSLVATCRNLPAETFLEVRAIYPVASFTEVNQQESYIVDTIVSEEGQWAEEANRRRIALQERQKSRDERMGWGRYLLAVLSGLALVALLWLFRRFGKRPDLPQRVDMVSEIPDQTPPALLYYLLHQKTIGGAALTATMFDLARRGILSVTETASEKTGFFGGRKTVLDYQWKLNSEALDLRKSSLRVFELQLLEFLFNELPGDGMTVSVKTIQKQQGKFTKFFSKWSKVVREEGKKQGWYDRHISIGMYWGFGLAGLMTLIGLVSIPLFEVLAVIPLVTAVLIFVGALLIDHRTLEGEVLFRKWRALKKYLKETSAISSDEKWLNNIEGFLVYSVILGISGKALKKLAESLTPEQAAQFIPWYIVIHNNPTGGIGEAFSAMSASTASALSSATGAGGGASGGGGGGAGGGGGGAG